MSSFIPISEPDLSGNELKYVSDCITSGWISSAGQYISGFESSFARWCGVTEGVATANGTVALHLLLHALGVGPGDEVIVPTFTFVASANAVRFTGATPVFADAEYATWGLDPGDVEQRITPRTKAILPVHLFGHPARMDELMRIAARHDLVVVEDAAESHGAEVSGQRVGGIGHAGMFSFYGNKILTTGEGGMIVTSNPWLANRARMLRDHGMSQERRYWHEELGFNYRMTNLQAAVGLAQLERVDWLLARKRSIAERYRARLEGVAGLTMPPRQAWATNVYWMFSVLVDEAAFGVGRDELMEGLRENSVDARRFFYPMHTMPLYQSDERFPVAEDLGARGLNLPSSVRLTDEQVDRVADTIVQIAAGARTAVAVA